MHYAKIKNYDIANGPGIRVSLFVSGCTHQCKGCFNPETWDFDYGTPFTEKTIAEILEMLAKPQVAGLSLLGGEPMEKSNQESLLSLVEKAKEFYPSKSIWCYTGYDFENDIMERMYTAYSVTKRLLSYIDIMVDGKFIEELKNINLRFRGSSNQRIIRVKETLESGKLLLWEPENN